MKGYHLNPLKIISKACRFMVFSMKPHENHAISLDSKDLGTNINKNNKNHAKPTKFIVFSMKMHGNTAKYSIFKGNTIP